MIDAIVQDVERKGYSLVCGLINPSGLKAMNDYFDQEKDNFQEAMVGPAVNRQRVTNIRGDHTLWIDPLNPPGPFQKLMEFLNQLKDALNEKCYLGIKEFEGHLAYYPPGTFYKKHSDRFGSDSTRVVSFVFYLNTKWESEDGGELILYNEAQEVLTEIKPAPGNFICFISEEFPHEVKSGKLERRSLTGWMHTKIIY